MKWAKGLCAGMVLLATPGTGLTVDCENAFTKMEQAICADPRLVEIERKLSVLADAALGAGQINRAQSQWLHDSIAQDCRRSSRINQCLLTEAEQRIQWLARVTRLQTVAETDF